MVVIIFFGVESKANDRSHASSVFNDSLSIRNDRISISHGGVDYLLHGWVINKSHCKVKDIYITVEFHTIFDSTISTAPTLFVNYLSPKAREYSGLHIYLMIQQNFVEYYRRYISKATIVIDNKEYTFRRNKISEHGHVILIRKRPRAK